MEGERFDLLLMDQSRERCEFLANTLTRTTIIHADATRRVVLEEERVGSADVFVACTGDDENNIISCLLAEKAEELITGQEVAGLEGLDAVVAEGHAHPEAHVTGGLGAMPAFGAQLTEHEIDHAFRVGGPFASRGARPLGVAAFLAITP